MIWIVCANAWWLHGAVHHATLWLWFWSIVTSLCALNWSEPSVIGFAFIDAGGVDCVVSLTSSNAHWLSPSFDLSLHHDVLINGFLNIINIVNKVYWVGLTIVLEKLSFTYSSDFILCIVESIVFIYSCILCSLSTGCDSSHMSWICGVTVFPFDWLDHRGV